MQFRQTQLLVVFTLNMVIFLKIAPKNSKFSNINVNITYNLLSEYRNFRQDRAHAKTSKTQ